MKSKVFLVIDAAVFEFKILDNAEKAWNCFCEWCNSYDDTVFKAYKPEALASFKNKGYYIFDYDYDRPFMIAEAEIE